MSAQTVEIRQRETRYDSEKAGNRSAYSIDVDAWRFRSLVDCWLASTAPTWDRRAALLEWALPRPGDFVGNSTAVERAQRAATLRADADACRRHAALLRGEVA